MKSILLVKKRLGLVEMTSGLVNASFSLPEWQAVKMIFFALWFINCEIIRLSPSIGYRQVQLFLSTTLNPLTSMCQYLCTSIRESAKIMKRRQSRAAKHIKIYCLPQDSLLNHSWHWRNYFHGQIKISKKSKQAVITNSGLKKSSACTVEIYPKDFPYLFHKYTEITHFCFERLLPTLILTGHFHFLHFIYFQIVVSIFSFSFDMSTYFQIDTPSFGLLHIIEYVSGKLPTHPSLKPTFCSKWEVHL